MFTFNTFFFFFFFKETAGHLIGYSEYLWYQCLPHAFPERKE